MKHNTYYYGGDILNHINSILCCKPTMDRGGVYIWVIVKNVVYCGMEENDCRGCLEIHSKGMLRDQLDGFGILTKDKKEEDYCFTEKRKQEIDEFLKGALATF